GPVFEASEREAVRALTYAYEHGVNFADFATAGAETFRYAGAAFASVRSKMFYQIHFGANYETGEYGWTTNLDTVKRQIDWKLSQLKTDYIDFGMIHCRFCQRLERVSEKRCAGLFAGNEKGRH